MVPLVIDFVDEMYKEHRMGQWNHQKVEHEFVLPLCPGNVTHPLPSCQPAATVGSRLDSEKWQPRTKDLVTLTDSTWTFCVY